MIRDFIFGDHLDIELNEFSDFGNCMSVFFDDSFVKYTLKEKEEVKCIMCWKQYSPKQYAVFFLMSNNVNFKHARALKKFIDSVILNKKPKSCLTYSYDCDKLNRWHKFFGFKQQRESLLDQAEGFNTWLMKWA